MPGDAWQRLANLRLLYGYMWCHPGKKLVFMGNEFGQWREWDFDRSLHWHLLEQPGHAGLKRCLADLNALVIREKSLHQLDFDGLGFEWIDCHDWANSILAFLRRGVDPNDFLVVCCNFTPIPRHGYRVGVPAAGVYDEVFNGDSSWYGGSNVGNAGSISTERTPAHGHGQSLVLSLPPLSTIVLKPRRG